MMLELHDVTIGQQISALSLTVSEGQLVTITGSKGSGKSLLIRAVLGLIPIDGGFISIDGELSWIYDKQDLYDKNNSK